MMPFTRDCQRGKCCTVTCDAVHEGLPEGEMSFTRGCQRGEMLHGNI